ncbi:MAG: translation elongation factor Ts [Proteobacteria bacterium]|nr:translation elongation factor Ts [Pseudomonadota bacterium]
MSVSAKDVKALRDKTGAGMMDCKKALGDANGDVEKAIELLRERGLAKAGKRAGRETTEGAIGVAVSGGSAGIVELGCETDFVAKTDEYQALAREVAEVVCQDASLGDVAKTLAASLGGETVEARITATIAKVGENIELKRVGRIDADGGVANAYVHVGGKLGVVVALTGVSGADGEALAKDVAMHVAAADPTPLAVDRDGVDADVVAKEREILTKQAQQSGKPDNVIEKMVEGRIRKFFSENVLVEQAFVKDPDTKVGDLVKGKGAGVAGFLRFRLGEASES